jgi:Leucine Rich repeat
MQMAERAVSPMDYLNASSNPIGDPGAFMLSCVIDPRRCPQQLTQLLLDNCQITDVGGAALV